MIGESCRALGFNTDFAPVVDLAFEASRTVMSSRAVSADPKQAVLYAREFLSGLRAADVLGSAKHFPGLGEANLDTHHELPSIDKSWKKLWAEDLYPYRTLAPRTAHGADRTRRLSRGHARRRARHRFRKSGSPMSCARRSAIAAWSSPTIWKWAAC